MNARHRRRRPPRPAALIAIVAVVVVGAVGTGVAFAATRPAKGTRVEPVSMPATRSWSPTIMAPPTTVAAAPASAAPASAAAPTAAAAPAAAAAPTAAAPPAVAVAAPTTVAPAGPITYTVKPGDTLSTIAAWFQLHGYGALYQANMAVIGADPNLIHPGQTITIAGGSMTVG